MGALVMAAMRLAWLFALYALSKMVGELRRIFT